MNMKYLSVVAPTPLDDVSSTTTDSTCSISSSESVSDDEKSVSTASSMGDSTTTSSSSSPRTLRSTVDGNKIRSRLLSRLGIVQQQPPLLDAAAKEQQQRRIAQMRKVAPFSEPLKFNDEAATEEDPRDMVEGSSSEGEEGASPRSTSSRKSVVAFDNEVSVVCIPKHQEYSKRIRSRLWCDKRELRNMAARNTLEYQSEGWNPSTVVEDEGFITMATGEKIHPVHLQRLFSSPFMMRRQPMKVMQLQPPMQVSRHPSGI